LIRASLNIALCLVLLLCSASTLQASPLRSMINSVSGANKAKPPQPAPPRDKWALLIGIGHFKDEQIQPLKFADKNVVNLASLLVNPQIGRFAADHVLTVVDTQAVQSNILTQLTDSWLTKRALPNDMIVLYFCGRAQMVKNGTDVLLLAYDSPSTSLEAGIPLKQVISDLRRRTQSKDIVCLLDISPLKKQGQEQTPDVRPGGGLFWQQLSQEGRVTVLAASEALLPSYENPMAASSLFSHYLVDSLQAGGGAMSLEAIAQYLTQNVSSDARNLLSRDQSPQYFANPDYTEISKLAIGIPGTVPLAPKPVNFGHPIDTIALTRPDLFRPRKMVPQEEAPSEADQEDDEGDPNIDYGPYMAKMKKDIQAKWIAPRGLTEHRIVAMFKITSDGRILDPRIVESSGVDSVDESALKALAAASPLDPLPKGGRKSIEIKYQFDWRVSGK